MSAQSHIAPMLPLARTAANAGHEVVFATAPDAVAAVQRAGLKALPAGLPFEEMQRRYTKAHGNELASLSPQERLAHILRHGLIGIAAPAMLEHLLPFARTWQPDLSDPQSRRAGRRGRRDRRRCAARDSWLQLAKVQLLRAGAQSGTRGAVRGMQDRSPPRGDSRLATPYLDIWPEGLHPQTEDWQYPNMWPLRPENALPSDDARPASDRVERLALRTDRVRHRRHHPQLHPRALGDDARGAARGGRERGRDDRPGWGPRPLRSAPGQRARGALDRPENDPASLRGGRLQRGGAAPCWERSPTAGH